MVQLFARHIDSLRAIIRNELNIRVKRQCNMKNPRSEHGDVILLCLCWLFLCVCAGPSDAFFAAFLLRLLFNIHKSNTLSQFTRLITLSCSSSCVGLAGQRVQQQTGRHQARPSRLRRKPRHFRALRGQSFSLFARCLLLFAMVVAPCRPARVLVMCSRCPPTTPLVCVCSHLST